jgi:hypothetical protein
MGDKGKKDKGAKEVQKKPCPTPYEERATVRLGAHFPRPSLCEFLLLPFGLALIYTHAWILDDAFVYFRYADNALLGNGLVYNKGEFVEGFTSPIWMLLVLAARTAKLGYPTIALMFGTVFYTVCWGLMVLVNRSLSPRETPILNVPLMLTATGLATTTWFTSGMETSLMMVCAPLVALFVLKPSNRLLQAGVGLLFLVRPEYALVMVVAALWAWRREGRFPLFLVCAWSAIIAPWMLFRIYYYADLFPNTFYLKDGTDILRGLTYVYDGAHAYHLVSIGAVLTGLLLFCGRKSSKASLYAQERCVMFVMALAAAAYVIKVGGDTWHFRLILFPYVLCLCALSGALEMGLALFEARQRRWACVIAAVFLLQLSLDSYPNQLNRNPFCIKWEWLNSPEIRVLGEKRDTGHYGLFYPFPHRMANGIECPPFGSGRNALYDCRSFAASGKEKWPPSATGAAPYEDVIEEPTCYKAWTKMGSYITQNFGLTNPILARTDVPSDLPGHKFGLWAPSEDISALIRKSGGTWNSGMFEHAVTEGNAPRWISKNIEAIVLLEKKALNHHNFGENLHLALRSVPTIHIEAAPKTSAKPAQQ